MPNPALAEKDPGAYMAMGITAENLAAKYGISRAEQEDFAVRSHQKAAAAQSAGKLADEIVAIETPDGARVVTGRLHPRGTTAEKLATLKPAFNSEGTVTAGTSSPLTDGAAAVLVVSEEFARAHGLKMLARIRVDGGRRLRPDDHGHRPGSRHPEGAEPRRLSVEDLKIIESNEAFAVQALSVARELGFDDATVNLDGGALALGHPLGATGARITGKAAQLLEAGGRRVRACHPVHRRRPGHRHRPGSGLTPRSRTEETLRHGHQAAQPSSAPA